jgi:hypothetical protein
MGLADSEIREVLARAQEIQSRTLPDATELEAVIQAAEQVGIPRGAVERALRERLNMPARAPVVGDLTFAKSADDKFYVAEVVSASDMDFRVRFLRGGEHIVSLDELRPCTLLPGERVVCPWPRWGPWTCTVLTFDAANQRVTVSDGWGEAHTFEIAQIWIAPPRRRTTDSRTRARVYATLIGAGATAGAIIGSIITALILR